jgi:uncharacterized hydrophobic protein (TIGR00271 family)
MERAGAIRLTTEQKRQHYFGVWGVHNYYTKLELQARAGAEFTVGYVLLILAAGLLAVGGLLIDSAAVIIGSMCVAPLLSPSRAVCLGGLYLDKKIFWRGLFKQIVGLLVVGAGFAFLVTILLKDNVPGIEITHEILLRAMPTSKEAILTLLIAVAAGAGASLALTADPHIVEQPWGQIIDVMIGVEIAISSVPPASVIGIGLALGRSDVSLNAFWLVIVNVVALDILGSMLIFLIRGIRRRHFDLERTIRTMVEGILSTISNHALANSIIDIILLDEDSARVEVTVKHRQDKPLPDTLAQTIASELAKQPNCRSEVTVEMIPYQTHVIV